MNFSLSSAARGPLAFSLVILLLAGCGPSDGDREYRQGLDAYEVRDLKKADKLLTDSLACAPDDVDRLVSLARVKLDLAELTAAKDLMAKAALVSEGDADVRLLTAQIAWHAKDYKAAAAGFSALADDTALPASVRAQGWAGLGVVEMTCDNYHLARVDFLRAIRLDRRNASAWYHLGLLYRDDFGYYEAALEQFEIYVRLEAEASPRVQKVQRNAIPQLKEKIAQTLTERPGVAKRNAAACSAALARAEAAMKKGAFKNARQAYQEALAADPLSYPAALGLAQAWEKTDGTRAGQEKAFESYKSACSLRPSSVKTFLTAGALATKLGFHSQAVEIYSRAVAASPTSPDALDGLIRALRKVGNKTSVAQAYQLYRDSVSAARRK